MADILHGCTICHAVAAEPDVIYQPACERYAGGWTCWNTTSCRRRLERRVRQINAAYHQANGEIAPAENIDNELYLDSIGG